MQEVKPGVLLNHLNNIVFRYLHHNTPAECAELSSINARIIRFVARETERDVYQKDVEKEFCITRSTASRVLMLMEQKGYVVRCGVKHDARLKKLILTEKSLKLNEVMEKQYCELDEMLLRGFTPEEADQLTGFVRRMCENVEQHNHK